MTLSFHVCNGLCPEQVYAGMQARYDAYFVDIPDEYFPKDLLNAVSNHGVKNTPTDGRYVASIAICPPESK